MLELDKQQSTIAAHLPPLLGFDNCPDLFYQHIAGIIVEEPPCSPEDLMELIQDFLVGFKLNREDSLKACQAVFKKLTGEGLITAENKFHLNAEKLEADVVLETIMSVEGRKNLNAKRKMAGCSND